MDDLAAAGKSDMVNETAREARLMAGLTRGTYVIMNDCDAPEGKLVAVLTRYDDKRGFWHALYLSPQTNMAAPRGGRPTPLSDFAKTLEWRDDEYRIIDTYEPVTARYRDGMPRAWQDHSGVKWRASRPRARKACEAFAAQSETV